MTFTAPGFLFALPLAAAPLLLHLFSLRRAKHVPFGDLSLLREIHARAMPRTRLRSWFLAAARCLLLLFLILAYAGPVLPSAAAGSAGAAEEGLDLVLLLDCSYSMGYRVQGKTRFEMARKAAEELVAGLAGADRVAVGVFSDGLDAPLQWVAKPRALEVLSRAKLGHRGTDFAGPLKAAYDLLSAPQRRRAVVLLSDGARHGVKTALPADAAVHTLSMSWSASDQNSWVASVGLSAEPSSSRPRLAAVMRASGLSAPLSTFLDIWVDGAKVAGQALRLEPGREVSAAVPLPSAKTPEIPVWSGSVSLRPDSLSADDGFFFSFRRNRRPRVLCLYGNPDFFKSLNGGYFLREILGGTQESLLGYDADFLELSRLGQARLSDYRAVVLSDFKDIPEAAAGLLDQFVRRRGGLWVLPGSRTAVEGFKAADAWLPAHVGPAVASPDARGLKAAAQGPWREFELARVAVGRYHRLEPRPGSKTLLTTASGDPLLVEGPRGAGKIAVWASSLDTGWSNIAVKPVFAAFIDLALKEVSPAAAPQRENLNVKIGETLSRVWDSKEAAPARIKIRSPDGRSTSLWVKDRKIEFGDTFVPGLYTLTEDGAPGVALTYAVNLDRSAESDLTPLEDVPWKKLRPESIREDFLLGVFGEDIRSNMFGAALAFLILEMLLSLPRTQGAKTAKGLTREKAAALAVLILLSSLPAGAQQGDRFVWTQLKLGEDWDPYPGVAGEALQLLSTVTSVLTQPERREITLKDPLLFSSPLIILAGRQAPPSLDDEELRNLRNYITGGGMLWIEDVSGTSSSAFDRWARRLVPTVLPEAELVALEPDHVVFKTFFLLRQAAGRVMVRAGLEGAQWAGRTAVVYSRNDLLGAWAKDALGRPLFACAPGGEPQRHNAKKLTINILMYSLTGSYKSDAVHQPFLLQKMRSGIP